MPFLNISYRGHNNTMCDLDADAFTQLNFIPGVTTNDLLNADTPKGVLGGSVAGIKGSMLVGKGDAQSKPIGWYVDDAIGNPLDSVQGFLSSGKGVFVYGKPTIGIAVYETHTEAGAPLAPYTAGDVLYCSTNGLATKEAPDIANHVAADPIGIVVGVPTASSLMITLISLL